MTPNKSLRALFNEALERDDPVEQARFLDEVCGADAVLRGRVEKLLRAHEEAGGFFSEPSKVPASAHATGTIALRLTEKPGDKIGRYKVLQQIGEGGCGVVYMAEQREPVRRRVALKVIKPGMDTKQVIARFDAERQALALMDHPTIAKVLDAGATETGRPYFVMELVRGTRITEFCDENKLSTEDRLKLFIQVCQAVQHAHQKGVIHRDIKPSNILVTINDGVPVPKVIDFGIAKATAGRLTDQTLFTAFEQFIGTPAYMSPEQAMMTSVDIDTRSDIYSLGVLLYELLTSRTPFDQKELLAAGLDGTRRIIQEDKPPRPSTRLSTMAADTLTTAARDRQTDAPTLLHLVRGDLDWIVMKCLEKDRARRYPTANGLARDIERHLNCEPVNARPPSRLYEFQKTVRRHRVEFVAAGAVIIALAVGLGISIWTLAKERRTRERAVAAERKTEQQLYTALLEQARASVQSRELGHRVRTLDAIRRAAVISNSADLRREAFAALSQPDLRFERQMTTDPHGTVVELDPRFEQIALCRQDGPVEIRATADQRLIATLPASTNWGAVSAEWSHDSRFLAVNRVTRVGLIVEIWDAANVRLISLLSGPSDIPVSFHPTQPRVLSVRSEDEVTIRDLESDLEVNHFKVGGAPIDLQFSDDGERFAVVYQAVGGRTIDVHEAAAGRVQSSLRFNPIVRTFAWHPRGRWIAVADSLGEVHLADTQTGETRALGRHKSQAVYAIFSPDGDYLFSGGAENELICWDLRSMQRAFTIGLQSSRLQFCRDGVRCAVVTRTEVHWHAFERSSTCREFDATALTRLYYGTFSPDGRWLVVTGRSQIGVWDWTRGTVLGLQSGTYFPPVPFFTTDNSKLFVYWADGIACWDLIPGIGDGRPAQFEPCPVNKNKTRRLYSAFVCSNDVVLTGAGGVDFLALTNTAGTSRFFSTQTGFGCVSSDHRYVALRKPSWRMCWVFRASDMTLVQTIDGDSEVFNFAFTPRGNELAVATRAGVDFYDSTAWNRTRSLPMRMDTYANVIFAPDGETVWISSDARSAALYRLRDLKILLPLPVDTLPLAISPDARYLAVSVESRRLQLWDLQEVMKQLRDLGLDW
jgi:serine/threonine protein kinase/WD40 repeat protein